MERNEGWPRSPAYPVPNVQTRVPAKGGLLRAPNGERGAQAFPAEGLLTCRELEAKMLNVCEEEGIPKDEDHINIIEETV